MTEPIIGWENECKRLHSKLDALRERLELTAHNTQGEPIELEIGDCDGIGCREATIKQQDKQIVRYESQLHKLQASSDDDDITIKSAISTIADLRSRLHNIHEFVTDPKRMEHWDSWRAYIAKGGGGSLPRDGFESMLYWIEEETISAVAVQTPSSEVDQESYDQACRHADRGWEFLKLAVQSLLDISDDDSVGGRKAKLALLELPSAGAYEGTLPNQDMVSAVEGPATVVCVASDDGQCQMQKISDALGDPRVCVTGGPGAERVVEIPVSGTDLVLTVCGKGISQGEGEWSKQCLLAAGHDGRCASAVVNSPNPVSEPD